MSDVQSEKTLRMPDINKVFLAGRLTRDPELKYIPSGTALCKIGLAVSRKYKTKSGENKEESLFINLTTWGATAEFCNEYMKKGTPVHVDGRLTMNEWDDKDTGKKRSIIEVSVERIQQLAWNGSKHGYLDSNDHQSKQKPKPRVIEEPLPQDDIPF